MEVSFTWLGARCSQVDEEGWVSTDAELADLLSVAENFFYLLHAGRYFPIPLQAFVEWFSKDQPLEDIEYKDLPKSKPGRVY